VQPSLWYLSFIQSPPRPVIFSTHHSGERRRLQARLPGEDGAQSVRRFERVSYNKLPPEDQPVRELVLATCWQAIAQRDSSPGATESAVKRHLQSVRESYYGGKYASEEQKRAVPYLPSTFKQALTIISDYSDCQWPLLYRYSMCPCGFIYRCDHRDAQRCPGVAYRGKPNEQLCDLPRTAARPLTYSSIGNFIQRAYKNPEIAEQFSCWRERIGSRGADYMQDICDGEAVASALADEEFAKEKRNLLLVLVTDPFIVSGTRPRERVWG
jgi:hypothetical protein